MKRILNNEAIPSNHSGNHIHIHARQSAWVVLLYLGNVYVCIKTKKRRPCIRERASSMEGEKRRRNDIIILQF